MARFTLEAALRGLDARDPTALARTVTLLESERADDREQALAVLDRALELRLSEVLSPAPPSDAVRGARPAFRPAMRIGITGPPGVGKSTFIEALGVHLLEAYPTSRLAVLAIDPSSRRTGGSILGDKTRMPRLAVHPRAFVRPSAAGVHLGGVAARTREVSSLCEAFGFDVILVETVGVGQSETDVADMVDTFVLLAQPGSGDELQGMKRGIMELCDRLVVNKADGDNLPRARITAADMKSALKILGPRGSTTIPDADLAPQVLLASALHGDGIDAVWRSIEAHRRALEATGELGRRHVEQELAFFRHLLREGALRALERSSAAAISAAEVEIAQGLVTPSRAAARVIGS
jgi:LAO/AO transport system kinase